MKSAGISDCDEMTAAGVLDVHLFARFGAAARIARKGVIGPEGGADETTSCNVSRAFFEKRDS